MKTFEITEEARERIIKSLVLLLKRNVKISATSVWQAFRENHPIGKVREWYAKENVQIEAYLAGLIEIAKERKQKIDEDEEKIDQIELGKE